MARRFHSIASPVSTVADSVRLQPIESLHLKFRTANVLRCRDIKSIGQLLDSVTERRWIVMGSGPRTFDDLRDALNSLYLSLGCDGGVDWIAYARRRRLTILPDSQRTKWTPGAFLQELPRVARTAVRSRFGRSGLSVLQDYFFVRSYWRTSLADDRVGILVSQRERARKIAADMVEMFVGVLWDDNYCGCKFRIHPTFSELATHPLCLLRQVSQFTLVY